MNQLLEIYRDFGRSPDRILSTQMLRRRGFAAANARMILTRLRKVGLAQTKGSGRVKLLLPRESTPSVQTEPDPIDHTVLRFKAKLTGFSVLAKRYPSPRPKEFVVAPRHMEAVQNLLREKFPETTVHVNEYAAERAVCLYRGKVRGKKATLEEALLHVYRHAPRGDFAIALQAALQNRPNLNWVWLRRQPEWPELAGIFVGVNDMAGKLVFPAFRIASAPDLSLDQLETVAQPFTARGMSA